jgi:hypothetical protein
LRRRRFVTLSLRHRAHADHDFAVDVQLGDRRLRLPGKRRSRIDDARLSKIVRAGIQRRADSQPDPAPFLGRVRFFVSIVPADKFLAIASMPVSPINAAIGVSYGISFPDVVARAFHRGNPNECPQISSTRSETKLLHPRVAAVRSTGHLFVTTWFMSIRMFLTRYEPGSTCLNHAAQRLVPRVRPIIDIAANQSP